MESDTAITHTECLDSRFAGAKTLQESHHQFIHSKNSNEKDFKISLFIRGYSLSAGENLTENLS